MRNFKFRIWAKYAKTWVSEYNIFHAISENDSYSVNQFTGLRDNTGKDIYEDDILQDDNGIRYLVYWLDTTASFEMIHYTDDLSDDLCEKVIAVFHVRNMHKLKVIGNVFENASLISKTTEK